MRRRVDYPLLAITLALTVAGLLILSSASVVISQKNFGTPYYYVLRHGIAALAGLGALFVCQAIPYKLWRKFSLPLLGLSMFLVAAVFIPALGLEFGGARRWLDIGPLSIQPSEILKVSLILYLASWLDRRKTRPKGFATAFVPFLLIISIVGALLVLQPDIGTLIVTAGAAAILYFLGGGRASQLASLAALAVVALAAIVSVAPYRVARLLVFLKPDLDPQGIGYHISQALIAIGSGGFWGRGFGQSIQKFNYLPEPIGDSVFAIIVEEFGFLGGIALACAFLIFFLRAMAVARRAPDFFGKLLVAGIASLIALQAFINMAAITGLMPLTGIPLPFISYGGTALVATLGVVGIMLNVSKHT
ncbi:MAG: putative lipid II flippase FtsW [Candidatus Sungbacteria bacterium]|uniref:Probable peptidoglycan glycosyltransferase FtsW n=1 Tax=Candidatus Sungiibacteriota bacterium TaxID=2750080 RepID=A0A932YVN2_9BACT|nr:putative lipid II flippase FtsW [Candidatus Sungbacteria bacterium]